MDNSSYEQEPRTQQEQQDAKRFWVSLPILGNLIQWLASLSQWTEEEQEEAGIYMDYMDYPKDE
jgi:hypothetical protein